MGHVFGNFLFLYSQVCGSGIPQFYGCDGLHFCRGLLGEQLSLLNKSVWLEEKGNTVIFVLTLSLFLSSIFIIGYGVSQYVRLKKYIYLLRIMVISLVLLKSPMSLKRLIKLE